VGEICRIPFQAHALSLHKEITIVTNDFTRLRDTDLNNLPDDMKEVPMLSFKCKICKEVVAEVSDRLAKDDILYGRLDKFVVYCKKCHDDLDAVQARLQKQAKLIFFTNEQLSILQKILEREKDNFINNQDLQDSIKNDTYDTMELADPRRILLSNYIEVNKMYRKVNRSMSELGLFGNSDSE
jgi:hypothetical protein